METAMHKELMRLAIHMLDNPNGIDLKTFDFLKDLLQKDDNHQAKELLDNVTIVQNSASQVAFLNEDWVEENYSKYE
jgi:hypothetical protein